MQAEKDTSHGPRNREEMRSTLNQVQMTMGTIYADAKYGINMENDFRDIEAIEIEFPSAIFDRQLGTSQINTQVTNAACFQLPIVKVEQEINLQEIMDVDSMKESESRPDDGYTANDEVG